MIPIVILNDPEAFARYLLKKPKEDNLLLKR